MSDKKDFGSIKQSLLSSGIPLEISTYRILEKMGYTDLDEYTYTRDEKIFQLDLIGEKDFSICKVPAEIDLPNKVITDEVKIILSIKILCECKYRTKEKTWFFGRFNKSEDVDVNVHWADNISQCSSRDTLFERSIMDLIIGLKNKYPKEKSYDRGIEISKGKKNEIKDEGKYKQNENSITRAVYQLLFASSDYIMDDLTDYIEDRLSSKSQSRSRRIEIYLPIIVTTCDLFALKESTIEEIEKSGNIMELSESVNSILICKSPPSEVKEYMENKIKYISGVFTRMGYNSEILEDLLRELHSDKRKILKRYYVINYYHLEEELKALETYYINHFNQIKDSCNIKKSEETRK